MQEQGTRERRWLRFHALTAPIGVAAITALFAWLSQSADESQAATVRYLNSAATKAYLATVTYALIAALDEGAGRMVFWAWSEHKKAHERFRNEGRQEAAKVYERRIAQQEAELAAAREREDTLLRERENILREREDTLKKREDILRERARAEGIDIDRLLDS